MNMDGCQGCLSSDRKLVAIKELKVLFNVLLNDFKLYVDKEDLFCPLLCWECYQKLLNIKKFQQNIMQAQGMLTNCLDNSFGMSNYKCLSNLSIHITTHIDYEFLEKENYYSDHYTTEKHENNSELTETRHNFKQELFAVDANDSDSINSFDDSKPDMHLFQIDSEKLDSLQSKENFIAENEITNQKSRDKKSCKIKKESNDLTLKNKKEKFKVLHSNDCKDKYKCVELDETEMYAWREKLKGRKGYRHCKYKCEGCIIGFYNKSSYNKHMSNKHAVSLGRYVCEICHVRFKTVTSLERHIKCHYIKYACTVCSRDNKDPPQALQHFITSHSKVLQCGECSLQFKDVFDLRQHYNGLHAFVVCDSCGFKSTSKQKLTNHIFKTHNRLTLKCDICNKLYKTPHTLYNHKKRCHEIAPGDDTYCVECDITFKNKRRFREHIQFGARHRKIVRKRKPCEDPCPKCGRLFTKRSNMMNHFNYVHVGKTNYYCQLCNRYFQNGYILKSHTESVHYKLPKPKNKICPYCERGFSTNKILTNHIRTHTGERPFACTECPASFAQSYALKTHFKTQHSRTAGKLNLQIK